MYKKDITIGYTCLDCNKVFKKHRYIQNTNGDWESVEYEVVCPQCSTTMYESGSAFKAPKSTDIKAWKNLKSLFENGYKFNPDSGDPFKESIDVKLKKKTLIHQSLNLKKRKRNKK